MGDNGAGKTNLLEALHVATQGFSPRTRVDAQLVRFGEPAAAVAAELEHGGVGHRAEVRIEPGTGKVARLDGAPLPSAEALRRTFPTLVFTPDRLGVVKGGPALRRAYFDRVLARLFPARSTLATDYADTVAQRNAALRRVQLGFAPREAIEPWTRRTAELGRELAQARREVLSALDPGFAELLAELGLEGGRLAYPAPPLTVELLERRLESDLATGTTGAGPHRDDVVIEAAGRELRSYGSQGQQRMALLALLLAEAALVPGSPLLLLDDVLSELDVARRGVLARRIGGLAQTLVTATQPAALPVAADQLVEVRPGYAR